MPGFPQMMYPQMIPPMGGMPNMTAMPPNMSFNPQMQPMGMQGMNQFQLSPEQQFMMQQMYMNFMQ